MCRYIRFNIDSFRRTFSTGIVRIFLGLSGSGKTESCKYIVQHILSRSLSIETALNMKINQVTRIESIRTSLVERVVV
jgi:ABC-type proline/glycine betaine transport system ATPase subunit